MNAMTKSQVVVGCAMDIKLLGVIKNSWIVVGGGKQRHYWLAFGDEPAFQLNVLGGVSGLGTLHGATMTQDLLDC